MNLLAAIASSRRRTLAGYDVDAAAWFSAVVAAGSSVSDNNKTAVSAFVAGCKSDGIWTAMKSVNLLCAASSLAGALAPLKGAAPTNFNFISSDYSTTQGLLGGSSKYLSSNRNINTDPQDSVHACVFPTVIGPGIFIGLIGTGVTISGAISLNSTGGRNRNGGGVNFTNTSTPNNLCGSSRSSSAGWTFRSAGTNETIAQISQAPVSAVMSINAFQGNSLWNINGRISFYSLGESLDLALLDARVKTLMTSLLLT